MLKNLWYSNSKFQSLEQAQKNSIFKKSFLLVNTKIKIFLKIFFFIFSKINI